MVFVYYHLISSKNIVLTSPLYIEEGFRPTQSLARFHEAPKDSTKVSLFQMIPICYTFLYNLIILGLALA